jgi:ring-1,2-phenylacetyl-CoA epoxidase subunit PaaE
MATHAFYPLQVAHAEAITRDAVAITFAVPPALRDTFAYAPGQYLTLRTVIDGKDTRRSYSICASAPEQTAKIAIKNVANGVFSNWATEHLKPGVSMDVMPPQGHFGTLPAALQTPPPTTAPRHIVAFAAGSGITPILSIVKTALLTEPETRITLVYGNRASSSVMFKEALEDLKDSYLGRLNLVWIMSRESQDIPLFNGRIDAAKCSALLTQWIDPASIDAAFICGPQDMMLAASLALQDKGVDKARIKTELFGTAPSDPTQAAHTTRAAVQGRNVCEVEVILDGTRHHFTMAKNQDNLIDAGLKAGLELPYACKGGVCSTCRGKVVSGEVDMDINFALEDYEVARGFVLCCQSYPVTDKLVINFDEDHAHN